MDGSMTRRSPREKKSTHPLDGPADRCGECLCVRVACVCLPWRMRAKHGCLHPS